MGVGGGVNRPMLVLQDSEDEDSKQLASLTAPRMFLNCKGKSNKIYTGTAFVSFIK